MGRNKHGGSITNRMMLHPLLRFRHGNVCSTKSQVFIFFAPRSKSEKLKKLSNQRRLRQIHLRHLRLTHKSKFRKAERAEGWAPPSYFLSLKLSANGGHVSTEHIWSAGMIPGFPGLHLLLPFHVFKQSSILPVNRCLFRDRLGEGYVTFNTLRVFVFLNLNVFGYLIFQITINRTVSKIPFVSCPSL